MADGTSGGTSELEVLRAIRDHYAPAVGTSDVAERVGISRQGADYRLRRLAEQGDVEKHEVGQSVVWWLTTQGRKRIDDGSG